MSSNIHQYIIKDAFVFCYLLRCQGLTRTESKKQKVPGIFADELSAVQDETKRALAVPSRSYKYKHHSTAWAMVQRNYSLGMTPREALLAGVTALQHFKSRSLDLITVVSAQTKI